MDILHKVAIANVIVNDFDDIITIDGNSINGISVDKDVLNNLIKQEEKDLEENFSCVSENEKDYELHRAERFQRNVVSLLEELLFILKEK